MTHYTDISTHLFDPLDEYRLFRFPEDSPAALDLLGAAIAGEPRGRHVLAASPYYQLARGARDLRQVNEFVLAQRAPGGIACSAFGVAEPKYGAAAIEELDFLAGQGAGGVVWSARAQGLFADDAMMVDFCRRAHERGLISMFRCAPYSTNEALPRIWRTARACPDATIVITGALMLYDNSRAVVADRGGEANIVYDTAGWNVATQLQSVAGAIGPERLLFGTGGRGAVGPAAEALERLLIAGGTPAPAIAAILGGNAARLLRLAATEVSP